MAKRVTGSVVWAAVMLLAGLSQASESFTPNDLRIYCGYLDAQKDEKLAKLNAAQRDAKIAAQAKVKPKELKRLVAVGGAWGDSCEMIGKEAEKRIHAALETTRVKGRVEFVEVQGEEWDKMVVRVRWKGGEDRFLEEEAATVAAVTYETFPMVFALAVAAYDPTNPEHSWFEVKIGTDQLAKIQKGSIDTFADSRYIRLFDGKKFATPRP